MRVSLEGIGVESAGRKGREMVDVKISLVSSTRFRGPASDPNQSFLFRRPITKRGKKIVECLLVYFTTQKLHEHDGADADKEERREQIEVDVEFDFLPLRSLAMFSCPPHTCPPELTKVPTARRGVFAGDVGPSEEAGRRSSWASQIRRSVLDVAFAWSFRLPIVYEP